MKSGKSLKPFFYCIISGALIFLASFYVEKGVVPYQFFKNIRLSVFSGASYFGSIIAELKNIQKLARDNIKLREENSQLLSQVAARSDLKEENDFLKKALKLPGIDRLKIIEAGIFNIQFSPKGYIVLVNKGLRDGIGDGDIIILNSGILVGMIIDTFDDYSRAILVNDSGFKATAKVLNKDISGMIRGNLSDGALLEFISQNDEIQEGDAVVTKGNDLFPAGFIIGTIKKIDSDSSKLFKEVSIKAAVSDADISRVLIILK